MISKKPEILSNIPISACVLFGGAAFSLGLYEVLPWKATTFLVSCAALAVLGSLRLFNQIFTHIKGPFATGVHFVHSAVFEALAVFAIFVLRPCKYWAGRKVGRGPVDGRPILLVHGYLHDSSAWTYQKKRLIQAGLGPIYTLNLTHPFRSISKYAEKVAEWAEHIEKETGKKELILIGHSMGGLVSSLYATRLAPPGKVTDVITIGSPLSGTHVAKIGLGANAREMERGSKLLNDLRDAMQKNQQTRFYHIATKTDQIVIPYHSSLVDGPASRRFVLEDIGHATLLFSKRVSDKIVDWLH